jgi:hypothetical protein
MTATITVTERTIFGNKRVVWGYVDITGYDTGGQSVSASRFGLKRINSVKVIGQENGIYHVTAVVNATGAYTTADTFKLYSTGGTALGTQTTSATDVGTIKVEVIGY